MTETPYRPLDEGQTWEIGGQDRPLTEDEQLEQLVEYLDAHFPLPDFRLPWKGGGSPEADRYCANLPDRITHAAVMLLGTGVDHTLPGTAFTDGVDVREHPAGVMFVPSGAADSPAPNGRFAVSLHSGGWWRGDGQALEMQWRPEVAAAAQLSGTTIVDVDYPLAPAHTVAEMVAVVQGVVDELRAGGAEVTVWGYSSGAALAALVDADAYLLTFPDFAALGNLPDDLRAGFELPESLPNCLIQTATRDEVAAPVDLPGAEHASYVATHRISTPKVARQRIEDTAAWLRR